MDRIVKDEERSSSADVSTVESQRNDLIPEEFPEGPYGSALQTRQLGKSGSWRAEQRPPNSFGYENRELHGAMERGYPGDDRSGENNGAAGEH
ncbi:hypothetical protein [Paenibacillus beijingensis]|uniref:Cytosolic protein n=1 Tax=Paenibacillus beijingensis TaxID=1126833 RepID=A0A0D5NEI5_9BACL|nr:hypothetical protein [Paenibacillus beijingensis]AJY73631.1 hypothetical protein VN24_02045 [Paenibacillus beijingensis]